MNVVQVLWDGLTFGFLFNFAILILMRWMPRGMLHMLPKYFTAGTRPATRQETRDFYRCYLPFLILIGFMMVIGGYRIYQGTGAGFAELYWHGYIIAMFMNLGDALFLDLLEIGSRRHFYAEAWRVDPEKLQPANFARHLTLPEHGLLWPLLICPLIGLLYALIVGALIS